jgi:uncharacterized membrane protein YvbJ
MRSQPPSDDYVCPHCGEPLQRKATFCRHCGSDEKTGWSKQYDHATSWEDAEDLEEAYEESLEREFGSDSRNPIRKLKSHRKTSGIPLWVMFVAIALVGLMIWQWLRSVG